MLLFKGVYIYIYQLLYARAQEGFNDSWNSNGYLINCIKNDISLIKIRPDICMDIIPLQ